MTAFFFHGWPGSRLDFAANHTAAAGAGVRVIAVDRPGIGGSDPQPHRTVLDWSDDVAALADSPGLERFAVFGFSFGGPYARACAYALPDRVLRAGLVSCLGPIDDLAAKRGMPPPTRYGLAAARLSPLLARPRVWVAARQARGGKMIQQLAKSMSPPDAKVLSRHDVAETLGRSLAESFRQGIGPATWDGVAVARGERFRLEDIRPEVLRVLHVVRSDGRNVVDRCLADAAPVEAAQEPKVAEGADRHLFASRAGRDEIERTVAELMAELEHTAQSASHRPPRWQTSAGAAGGAGAAFPAPDLWRETDIAVSGPLVGRVLISLGFIARPEPASEAAHPDAAP